MNLDAYQKAAFAVALPSCKNSAYMCLGLANESGEVLGKFKKVLRGDRTLEEAIPDISDEIGDVLWYLAGLATTLELDLNQISINNINKLTSRQMRGVLMGGGDNR